MKIYIASKVRFAARWRNLRTAGVPIISTWIDFEGAPTPELWEACAREPTEADAVVLFVEEGDTLKGCLVECGAALGAGKYVIQVGTCASLRAGDGSDASFVLHPNWRTAPSIGDALALLRTLLAGRDGPRYKALGNSMAVPCMRWIGQRIDFIEKGAKA